jgi:VWFA-related protein
MVLLPDPPIPRRGAGPAKALPLGAAFGLIALLLPTLPAQEKTDLQEEVEVGRVVVDVRVVDRHAQPIVDLEKDDFAVKVDGRPVRVESVEWIVGANPPLADLPPEQLRWIDEERVEGSPSRLIVLFFQRHTLPSRMVGLMLMLKRAREFVENLGPNDRVAILTFDSHLRLYSDFSSDREALAEMIRRKIVPYRPPPLPEAGPFPSLARHFDHDAARRAASPEEALLVIARALAPLKGSKTLLYIGWGMGVFNAGVVQMRPEYGPARRALLDARVSVFPLDVTRADFHTLEGPLIRVARDTGGVYVKTFYSSYFAMDSVAGIIAGRYELVFEKPDLPPGLHVIRVKLTPAARERLAREKRKPLLFFRENYDDRAAVPERSEPARP